MRCHHRNNQTQDLSLNFNNCLKLSEAIPSLLQIAFEKKLKLNRASDYKTIVYYYKTVF